MSDMIHIDAQAFRCKVETILQSAVSEIMRGIFSTARMQLVRRLLTTCSGRSKKLLAGWLKASTMIAISAMPSDVSSFDGSILWCEK